jgi:DNA-binding transcriptional LysR family regulator
MDIELQMLCSFVQTHEPELGAPLFRRGPQGLRPTSCVTALYAHALGILGDEDEMLWATRSRPDSTRLRLGMPDDYALGWPGSALREAALEQAEVGITCDLSAHLVAALQWQDLDDLALVTMAARPAQTRAEARVPLGWVWSAPEGEQVDLAADPQGCGFRRALIAAPVGAGQNGRVPAKSRANAGIFAAVRAGLAMTCVSRGTAPREPGASLYLVGAGATPRGMGRDMRAAVLRQLGLTAVGP